ncbi:uncharacterized protein LOC126737151 [Anthonomus grandis grandis]|uniref:uncharacterized protein LOC126737151 n=1 Tax=Anthonomus grandis grandis TaxID=2921223 RepID=UPI002164F8DA|nr:uncharacterized protein LOC126737151 [Anthonomus grandis grandis]
MRHIFVIYGIVIQVSLIKNTNCLDMEKLESLGINSDVYISDIAVYLNRAFLTIPRTICDNNVTHPTFVEVPWKEYNVILKSRFSKHIEDQIWAECDNLQNAISLAKEGPKAKLWILDKGNEFCPPKLMTYSIFHNKFLEEEIIELADIPKEGLSTIVVENEPTIGNHRAFIANAGENTILVCFLAKLECNKINLIEKRTPPSTVLVDFLDISKTDSTMYLTGLQSSNLWSFDLANLPTESGKKHDPPFAVNVKWVGETLGLSSGLETDYKNGLLYYLTKDYAIVRWNTEEVLQAENHEVLAQSYEKLAYVSRLFTDSQGSVYALVNPFGPFTCNNDTAEVNLDSLERVQQIMKYNRLLDRFFF